MQHSSSGLFSVCLQTIPCDVHMTSLHGPHGPRSALQERDGGICPIILRQVSQSELGRFVRGLNIQPGGCSNAMSVHAWSVYQPAAAASRQAHGGLYTALGVASSLQKQQPADQSPASFVSWQKCLQPRHGRWLKSAGSLMMNGSTPPMTASCKQSCGEIVRRTNI